MNSEKLNERFDDSLKDIERIDEEIEKKEKRRKVLKSVSLETRGQNRFLYSMVPWAITSIASIGLVNSGVLDPTVAGVLSFSIPAVIGTAVEAYTVRKNADKDTLGKRSKSILKEDVYNEVSYQNKLAQKEEKIGEICQYLDEILDSTKKEKTIEELEIENSVLNDAIFEHEQVVRGINNKLALDSVLPDYGKKSAIFGELSDSLLWSLIVTGSYYFPVYCTGKSTPADLFVPLGISFASIGSYSLVRANEKRKLYNKYDRLTFDDKSDIENLSEEELIQKRNLYAARLGSFETKIDINNATIDEIKENDPFSSVEVIYNNEPEFVKAWEEEQKFEKPKTLTKKK